VIWLAPVLVIVIGMVPVVIAAMRAAEEAKSLVWQVRVLGTLRPELVRLRTASQSLGTVLRAASFRDRSRL